MDKLKKIIAEEIKQITDGSEKALEGEMDLPAFYVDREVKKLVEMLDKIGYAYLDKNDEQPSELYDAFGSKILAISEDLEHFMKDQGYDSAMRKNYSRMMESVMRSLKESYEGTDSGVYQTLDACIDIIIGTEKKGRRFALPYAWTDATPERTRHESVLNNDQEYQQLREELLGDMEAYFNSAKRIIGYLVNSGYLSEYDLGRARKYLGAEFTPNW